MSDHINTCLVDSPRNYIFGHWQSDAALPGAAIKQPFRLAIVGTLNARSQPGPELARRIGGCLMRLSLVGTALLNYETLSSPGVSDCLAFGFRATGLGA